MPDMTTQAADPHPPDDEADRRYWKLQPMPPLTPDEYCDCAETTAIYLCYALDDNPVHCSVCRGVVAPERLTWLTDELIDRLASWTEVFGSIYKLWLDSGAYEKWAFGQLASAQSWVNLEGMAVARAFSAYCPCAYYWFTYEGDKDGGEDYFRPETCPVCGTGFEPLEGRADDFLVCPKCNIYI
jgi:hypothetical protein